VRNALILKDFNSGDVKLILYKVSDVIYAPSSLDRVKDGKNPAIFHLEQML
jgi:hypothetical protein